MSVAWFEVHQELARHRKTKRLAHALGIHRAQAIGHMVCLWGWALDHAEDGDLTEFAADEIAEEALWGNDPAVFVDALVEVGFVDRVQGHLTIHDWDYYSGKLIEQRRANRQRAKQSRERKRSVDEPNPERTGTVPAAYGATEQNRTEPKPTRSPSGDFEAFWAAYPLKRGKRKAQSKYTAALKRAPADAILAGAKAYALEVAGTPADKIKWPEGWLEGDRWDDITTPTRPPESERTYFQAQDPDPEELAEFAAAVEADSWRGRKDLA